MNYTFMVRNLSSGRTYPVFGHEKSTRNSVWLSQKCLYTKGTKLEITSPDGKKEVFVHE